MTVTFNYTGRVEVEHFHFSADITENSGAFEAVVGWDLNVYDFPPTATVDVYFQGIYDQLHFQLDQVGLGSGEKKLDLTSLRRPHDATVTLKVVQKDENGIPLLLGLLSKYRPTQNGKAVVDHSILPTQRDPHLPVPWRVQTESGRPVLHISDKHDLYASLTNSGLFMATVIPSVIQCAFEWLIWETEGERVATSVDEWTKTFVALEIDESRINELMALEEPDFADIRSAGELVQMAIDKYSTKHDLLKVVSDLFAEE